MPNLDEIGDEFDRRMTNLLTKAKIVNVTPGVKDDDPRKVSDLQPLAASIGYQDLRGKDIREDVNETRTEVEELRDDIENKFANLNAKLDTVLARFPQQ